ncbi:MAG: response regulator [Clostridia bacterium]|nr:response regulator [Clostridia bacterium]
MYRVALIDDEHIIVEGLRRVLPWEKMGCSVVGTAADGVDGLALIRREKPDILFTDIRMPNMDGLAMLAAVRSEFPRMQVSVLTAFRDFDYAQRAMHLGACRYLLKPSKMDELNEAVLEMIRRLDALPPESVQAEENADTGAGEASSFVVRAALSYMQAHCTQKLTLGDVADHVYVSQWHLSKLINRHMAQSFLDILAGMRIERAKQLLRDPSMRVHEVAQEAGFTDVAHFSKSFKRIVGKTPGEYRAELK